MIPSLENVFLYLFDSVYSNTKELSVKATVIYFLSNACYLLAKVP